MKVRLAHDLGVWPPRIIEVDLLAGMLDEQRQALLRQIRADWILCRHGEGQCSPHCISSPGKTAARSLAEQRNGTRRTLSRLSYLTNPRQRRYGHFDENSRSPLPVISFMRVCSLRNADMPLSHQPMAYTASFSIAALDPSGLLPSLRTTRRQSPTSRRSS